MPERNPENLTPEELVEIERRRREVELQRNAQDISQHLESQATLREIAKKPSLDWPEPSPILGLTKSGETEGETQPVLDKESLEKALRNSLENISEFNPASDTDKIASLMEE